MKTFLTPVVIIVCMTCSAQTRYQLPSKTKNFSQSEWLDIMSDIANDSFILRRMKKYIGIPIMLRHKPYVCCAALEHPIRLQFCPDCVWVVDSCRHADYYNIVSISADSEYGFTVANILTSENWSVGDTVRCLIFEMCGNWSDRGFCNLSPRISHEWIGAYAVFPDKKQKIIPKKKKSSRLRAAFFVVDNVLFSWYSGRYEIVCKNHEKRLADRGGPYAGK